MVKAIWNGKVVAEADRTEIVEGNHYFPSKSLREEFFQSSDTHTICPWKGKAHYYTLLVDGKENADAAWYYPDFKAGGAENRQQCCLLERCSDRNLISASAAEERHEPTVTPRRSGRRRFSSGV